MYINVIGAGRTGWVSWEDQHTQAEAPRGGGEKVRRSATEWWHREGGNTKGVKASVEDRGGKERGGGGGGMRLTERGVMRRVHINTSGLGETPRDEQGSGRE